MASLYEPSSSASSSAKGDDNAEPSLKKKKLSGNLSSFVVTTPKSTKETIDRQIAKAMFATNCSFRSIEYQEAIRVISLLRPGYIPPSWKDVSGKLLNQIYLEEKERCFSNLSGSYVNMSIDGWSNVHNEPIICATITTEQSEVILFDSIDTTRKAAHW